MRPLPVPVPGETARRPVRMTRIAGRSLLFFMVVLAATSYLIAPVESLWSKNLAIDGRVTMGGCQDFRVTGAAVSVDQTTGQTSYSYTLTGGGPGCNHDASFVAILPVCFNPELAPAGDVAGTGEPIGWTYSPKNKPDDMQVKWNADGTVGPGPFDAVFTFTLNGTDIPMVPTGSMVHAGGGQPDPVEDFAGTVTVPWPSSCGPVPGAAQEEPPGRAASGPPGGTMVPPPVPTAKPRPSAAREEGTVTRTPGPADEEDRTITPPPAPADGGKDGTATPAPTPAADGQDATTTPTPTGAAGGEDATATATPTQAVGGGQGNTSPNSSQAMSNDGEVR